MSIEINEVTENLDDAHKELVRAITVNSLVVQYYQKIRGPLNKPPIINIGNIDENKITNMPEISELSPPLRSLIVDRLMYWLRREVGMNWSTEKMMKRNRKNRFRKNMDSDSICEWPGCEESSSLVSDHRFPYSMGGEDDAENHGPLCRWHNLIKMNSPYMIVYWPGE